MFIIYLIFNFDTLTDVWLDYKEERKKKSIRNNRDNTRYISYRFGNTFTARLILLRCALLQLPYLVAIFLIGTITGYTYAPVQKKRKNEPAENIYKSAII